MTTKGAEPFFEELKSTLEAFSYLKLAIVFGSFARGNPRQESDIDLGVSAGRLLTAEEKMQIISGVAERFGRPVDLVDLQTKQEPILTQVLSKGRLLFCRDRRLYAELIKTMWYDQVDFLPYRNRILKARRERWINS